MHLIRCSPPARLSLRSPESGAILSRTLSCRKRDLPFPLLPLALFILALVVCLVAVEASSPTGHHPGRTSAKTKPLIDLPTTTITCLLAPTPRTKNFRPNFTNSLFWLPVLARVKSDSSPQLLKKYLRQAVLFCSGDRYTTTSPFEPPSPLPRELVCHTTGLLARPAPLPTTPISGESYSNH